MPRPDVPQETETELEPEDLTSRTDVRRAERQWEEALARLAKDLVELRGAWLSALELPESVQDAVVDARAIRSPPAQNRQLRLVRSALRGENWALIRTRVDALHKHGALPARLTPARTDATSATPGRAPEWTARLLGEGQSGIEALLAIAPHGDRTHLRTLVQNVRKAHADRRQKAEQRLTAAIASLLR